MANGKRTQSVKKKDYIGRKSTKRLDEILIDKVCYDKTKQIGAVKIIYELDGMITYEEIRFSYEIIGDIYWVGVELEDTLVCSYYLKTEKEQTLLESMIRDKIYEELFDNDEA